MDSGCELTIILYFMVNYKFLQGTDLPTPYNNITDGPEYTLRVPLQYPSWNAEKLSTEMRMILITSSKPKKIVRLDPIDPEDLNVDLETVLRWS